MKKESKQTYAISKQYSDQILRGLYTQKIPQNRAREVISQVLCGHRTSWSLLEQPNFRFVSLN